MGRIRRRACNVACMLVLPGSCVFVAPSALVNTHAFARSLCQVTFFGDQPLRDALSLLQPVLDPRLLAPHPLHHTCSSLG